MQETHYDLLAGYLLNAEIQVLSFTGHEAASAPFEFVVDVATDLDLVTLQFATLGHAAMMRWQIDGHEARCIFGVVQSVEGLGGPGGRSGGLGLAALANVADGVESIAEAAMGMLSITRLARYRLTLVPRLALLKQRRDSRVFEGKTTREIVDIVLSEHQVRSAWAPNMRLERRAYCVQYKETDFDFVTRLLAEEGIHFSFLHPSVDASAVDAVADNASSRLRQAVSSADPDSISSWSPVTEIGSEQVTFATDCDYPGIGTKADASDDASDGSDIPVLSAHAPGAGASYPAEETIESFGWKRSLTTGCVTVTETQLIDAISSTATADGGHDEKRASAEGIMRMARALAPSTNAGLGVSGVGGQSALHVLAASAPIIPRAQREDHAHSEMWDRASAAGPAARRLQSLRRDRIVANGTSAVRRLSAGQQFSLDHATAEIAAEYVVTRVTHAGHASDVVSGADSRVTYSNEFECVPAFIPIRPDARPTPHQQILETGTVVGIGDLDSRDEAHAGCVRVRFHWDRSTAQQDSNQCWVPVMQPWAGSSFGFQFIPRVGMQVMVGFLGGSESHPIILGSRHHQAAQPPFFLPDHLTQSGIRTKSLTLDHDPEAGVVPDRFNQLRFEDEYGEECAELFSSGDTHVIAERNALVKARETLVLSSDQQEVAVTGHQVINVDKSVTETIGGPRTVTLRGTLTETMLQNTLSQVLGYRTELVGQNYDLTVQGDSEQTITGDRTTVVLGDSTQRTRGEYQVQADQDVTLAGRKQFTITTSDTLVLKCGQSTITLTGDAIEFSSPNIRAKAGDELTLGAKKTSLDFTEGKATLTASDTMELASADVSVHANDASAEWSADGVTLSAAKAVQVTGDTTTLTAKGASVKLDTNVTLQASQIALNSGSGAAAQFQKRKAASQADDGMYLLATQLIAPGGKPVAFEQVNILDPKTREVVAGPVTTDEHGEFRVEVPDDGEYDIELVPRDRLHHEPADDHEANEEIHAYFVDHRGTPLPNLDVELKGEQEFSLNLTTGELGMVTAPVPAGEYVLNVDGDELRVHTTPMADRTRRGRGPYVFVLQPDEPEGVAHDVRANRASPAQIDNEAEVDE